MPAFPSSPTLPSSLHHAVFLHQTRPTEAGHEGEEGLVRHPGSNAAMNPAVLLWNCQVPDAQWTKGQSDQDFWAWGPGTVLSPSQV